MPKHLKISALALAAFGLVGVCLPAFFSAQAELPPVKTYTAAAGLPRDTVRQVRQDARDFPWFCTLEGLLRFDGYGFKLAELPSNAPDRYPVGALYEDAQGVVWIGAKYDGLLLAKDQRGYLWAGAYVGRGDGELYRLLPQGQVEHFTNPIHALLKDPKGRGVSALKDDVLRQIKAHPVADRSVFSRYHATKDGLTDGWVLNLPTLELSPAQTNVRIDFLSPGATADPHLRYQYKLEGRSEWSAPTAQRSVDFANLAAGSYRFLVRAVNADGGASTIPASVSFTVTAPVWRRWWFILLTASTVGGLGYAAYRYRVAQLLALERMRLRIATDLHDEVGSSLSQIAILSEVARQNLRYDGKKESAEISRAAEPLEKVAATSRAAIDAMSDIVWAINPQRDYLSDLTQRMRRFASDTLTARDIRLRFRAPEQDLSLDADVRRQVFLIFKECVNNIVRHAGCAEVEVDFTLTDHHLSLRVWDDGHGFVETRPRPGQNGGNGLLSMRRRAAELGGRLEVFSGNGNGTIVKLEAPLQPRRR